ncbi:T9SS type A sorting domain-containing protein [Lacinutrix salivirga]
MKRIVLLIAILNISFLSIKVNAQDPELTQNSWYLQNLIIDGDDNFPPSNSEVQQVTLEFDTVDYDFSTKVFNTMFSPIDITYNTTNTAFTVNSLTQTLSVANLQENQDFEIVYFQEFWYPNDGALLSYTIVQNTNGSRTLTITATNGDQAIYGSSVLNTKQESLKTIEIYPNPVVNQLTLKTINNKLSVSVFNSNGQLKMTKNIESANSTSINIEALKAGIYFFVFKSKNGKTETRKVVKI